MKRILLYIILATIPATMLSLYRPATEDPLKQEMVNNQAMMAILYHQRAAEYRALCYQTFNLAQAKLMEKLTDHFYTKPPAIVVDIDETILDNSPFEAKMILKNLPLMSEDWTKWINSHQCAAVPGAADFLHFVKSRDVEIFYITNRRTDEMLGTLENLRALGLPDVQYNRMLVRKELDGTNKEPRRQKVAEKFDILLLVGDNLNDFTSLYEKQPEYRRTAITDSLRNAFGERFIILPNPMYGDWEDAIYHYNTSISAEQKDSIRKAGLRAY